MERAGKAAKAAMDTADAAKWRRENTLLLGMFVFLSRSVAADYAICFIE